MVDLVNSPDPAKRAKEVEQLEADVEMMKDKHSAKEMHQVHHPSMP